MQKKNNKDLSNLNSPIQSIKGVGEARAALFHKLGIFTLSDMLNYFPRDYEDRSEVKQICDLVEGEGVSFVGHISSKVSDYSPQKRMTISKVKVSDSSGSIHAIWYNQPYIKNLLKFGDSYYFFGKITRRGASLEIQNPVYEKVKESGNRKTGRIVPIYQSTLNLSQNIIRTTIESAMALFSGKMEEYLPLSLMEKHKLSGINESISNIHFPRTDEDYKNARYRLVFEEFFLLQLGLLSIKEAFQELKEGISFHKIISIEAMIKKLPYELTAAQKKVLSEIETDMETNKVMNRLIQGDVGSGKTVIAMLALYKCVKSGYQGVLMVPTEILAIQHFASIIPNMESEGIRVALLTGSMTKKKKQEVKEKIASHDVDIIIGTHALLEEDVIFEKIGLVITDEQHRFGVRQRSILTKKGLNPDVLIMTATPIPRTLALFLYGDLDISVIDEMPVGRMPIKTFSVDDTKRERVNKFIKEQVSEGRQVYIVCPLVEDSEEVDAKSATMHEEKISKADFPELRISLLHGKMKPKEKDAVMNEFMNGNLDILVSTTVIEVGVNVANASVMVIENAERFGLSQLHQLRGRVGRSIHQSYCLLYSESQSRHTRERMKIMEKTNDGFVISEKDLEIRGPGEFFGTRQHGLPEFKIANIYTDISILKLAQADAIRLIKEDPLLVKIENQALKKKLIEKYGNQLKFVGLN